MVSDVITRLPGGVSGFGGVPLVAGLGGYQPIFGKTFVVDQDGELGNGVGDDGNPGTVEAPLLTVQAAIDLCESGRGDLVLVAEGGYVVTQTVSFNKAGITVAALGFGINPGVQGEFFAILANASFTDGPVATVTSPCRILGMGFASRDTGSLFFAGAAMLIGGLATASPFGVHVLGCRFPKWGLDNRIGIAVEGSSDILIEGCTFEGVSSDFEMGIYVQGATQNITIRRNDFRQCEYAVEYGAFAGGGPHALIHENICEDSKLLNSNGNTAPTHVAGNWLETATDAASYDATVATLQGQGIQFSDNHYSE